MPRWSLSRQREWRGFTRALSRMGHALARQKAEVGSYQAPRRERRHPLLQIVMGDANVRDAIGDMVVAEHEQSGVLSWLDISHGTAGGSTLRINHKGAKARCIAAMEAAIAAIRRAGRRVSFHDLIRHDNQNGYLALLRIPDAPVVRLGFAR